MPSRINEGSLFLTKFICSIFSLELSLSGFIGFFDDVMATGDPISLKFSSIFISSSSLPSLPLYPLPIIPFLSPAFVSLNNSYNAANFYNLLIYATKSAPVVPDTPEMAFLNCWVERPSEWGFIWDGCYFLRLQGILASSFETRSYVY